jgi:hypothetical protein
MKPIKHFFTLAVGLTAVFCHSSVATTEIKADVEVKQLTHGPKFHWFGYYDKFQFDPSERFLLGMQVDFEFRWNTPEDAVKIGIIDLENDNRWIELAESRAWSWQQGCMLQWVPGSDSEIIFNDREDGRFVSRIMDVRTRETRTLPHPIYHVSPNGKQAVGTSFSRIYDQRADYGYPGVPDPYKEEKAPEEITIYLLDLETGERTEILSLADIAKIRYGDEPIPERLRFNHIQFSPNGERIFFLNRRTRAGDNGTVAYTSNLDGTDIRKVGENSSHFQWRDDEHINIWSGGAYRLHKDDGSGKGEIVFRAGNGHQTYIPSNKDWMVTDTYPTPRKGARLQTIYLYHFPTDTKVILGSFPYSLNFNLIS